MEKADNTIIHNGEIVTLKEARQIWAGDTLHKWEEEWDAHQLSRWTHFLFPTVQRRLDMKDLVPTFWSTQAITGHSVFRGYLKTRVRVDSESCPCGFGIESAEHVFRECIRHISGRPTDWEDLTMDHIRYMERITLNLWEEENPNFKTRRKR